MEGSLSLSLFVLLKELSPFFKWINTEMKLCHFTQRDLIPSPHHYKLLLKLTSVQKKYYQRIASSEL